VSLNACALCTRAYYDLNSDNVIEALKASFIVPRSPTPVPLEDRPVEELTMDELRELLRRERVSVLSAGHGMCADSMN